MSPTITACPGCSSFCAPEAVSDRWAVIGCLLYGITQAMAHDDIYNNTWHTWNPTENILSLPTGNGWILNIKEQSTSENVRDFAKHDDYEETA